MTRYSKNRKSVIPYALYRAEGYISAAQANKITDMTEYFQYGEKELSYLKQRDKRLSEIIDKVGWVKRRVIPNLFAALVHSIVGQQISTKAHETIWQRIQSSLGEITPQRVISLTDEELQRFGISFKKVTYIKRAATKILNACQNSTG